jgi:alginate O-acetyltransferase complex protein AlgI
MLFVAFFPQLVAGPIVRASEFLPQLLTKIDINRHNVVVGLQLFLGGAIQKVLFADNLSKFVDPVFLNPDLFSSVHCGWRLSHMPFRYFVTFQATL